MGKNIAITVLSVLLAAVLILCAILFFADRKNDDIVILFTNDVHCGIEDDIGYAGLAAYKKEMEKTTPYVSLVDCGDHMQGSYIGSVSQGECIVEIMNAVGYDFSAFGNHEFDFGLEQLGKNVDKAKTKYLCCNLSYTGEGEGNLPDMEPYAIVSYGDVKVAFIGVTTPETLFKTTPAYFMEDGERVYSFAEGDDGKNLFLCVQRNVYACRKAGADYVILLAHLGNEPGVETPYESMALIANTVGIDAVLDGHSHTEMPCSIVKNHDGEPVLLAQTGTKLNNIGKLVITKNGLITVGYVEDYPKKDEEIGAVIREIEARYEKMLGEQVAHLDFSLSCNDENGIRMIRSREMAIGDLVADAYRAIGAADIGICNGGGIRADLAAGDIAYKDLISVNPYGNMLCVVKITGAELLDMLEYFYRKTAAEYVQDGKAFGEEGSFAQISGIRLTIDTSMESSVICDENDMLLSVGGARRVSDVCVLKGGEYVPVDPDAVYTLASHNYLVKNGGSGMGVILRDHELVADETIADYQVLIEYIRSLDGDFSRYQTVDDRITIR